MASPRSRARCGWPSALLLGVLAGLAFVPSLQNGFVYDDERYILLNPLIGAWSWDNLGALLTQPYFGNFHPLHHLAIALERAAFGVEPMGWHAVSLALHALNTALVLRLLLRLGVPAAVAWVGAALFGLHPVQAESVAWVSEQKNLLSLLFTLLSLDLYLRARGGGRRAPLLGSLFAFGAALASKVSAIGLLPVLMFLETFPPAGLGPSRGRPLLRLLPFAALGGAAANLGILAHGEAGFIHPYPGGTLGSALLSIGPVLLAYAKNLLWPLGLSAAYDLPPATEMHAMAVAGGWLLIGAALLAVARAGRRDGRVSLGAIWAVAFLLPVLNLVPIGTLMNDRYVYASLCALGPLAAAGLLGGLGVLARPLGPRAARALAAGGVAVVLLALAGGSFLRAGVWRDEERLWVDAVRKSPRSALARYNLGTLRLEQGRDEAAEPHLRAALEADPTLPRPYQNLGVIHFRQGRFRLAVREYRAALYLGAESPDLWMNLALAQSAAGELEAAIASLRHASKRWPRAGGTDLALGLLLEERGEVEQALRAFTAFLASGGGEGWQRRLAEEHIRALEERGGEPAGLPGAAWKLQRVPGRDSLGVSREG
jgi:tetratricopeptide (TPR) repeat protein